MYELVFDNYYMAVTITLQCSYMTVFTPYAVLPVETWSLCARTDIDLQPMPAMTLRTTGGILEFYMFYDQTPELVSPTATQACIFMG